MTWQWLEFANMVLKRALLCQTSLADLICLSIVGTCYRIAVWYACMHVNGSPAMCSTQHTQTWLPVAPFLSHLAQGTCSESGAGRSDNRPRTFSTSRAKQPGKMARFCLAWAILTCMSAIEVQKPYWCPPNTWKSVCKYQATCESLAMAGLTCEGVALIDGCNDACAAPCCLTTSTTTRTSTVTDTTVTVTETTFTETHTETSTTTASVSQTSTSVSVTSSATTVTITVPLTEAPTTTGQRFFFCGIWRVAFRKHTPSKFSSNSSLEYLTEGFFPKKPLFARHQNRRPPRRHRAQQLLCAWPCV